MSSNFKKFYVEGSQILTTKNELTESALKLFEEVEPMSLILVEGITVLNAEPTSKLCQLKFFATLDHETCLKRRTLRSYDPPDVPGDNLMQNSTSKQNLIIICEIEQLFFL